MMNTKFRITYVNIISYAQLKEIIFKMFFLFERFIRLKKKKEREIKQQLSNDILQPSKSSLR